MNNNYKKNGFSLLKLILIVGIVIVFISLLGFNLEQDVVMNETVQTNFSFIINWLSRIWDNHLASPVMYLWNEIIIRMLWEPFVQDILSGNFINDIPNPAIIQQ